MSLFGNTKKLKIVDDDGIIAIVNTAGYNSSLKFQEEWSWQQLNEFLLTPNQGDLIVFSTGGEGEWTVEFLIDKESSKSYFRKFTQQIAVTEKVLHLVSWSDLTSTLQFQDTWLPDDSSAQSKVSLPNGNYQATVKQMFDPNDFDSAAHKIHFVVELLLMDQIDEDDVSEIVWSENFPNDDSLFLSNEPNEFDDFLKGLLERDKNANKQNG